MLPAEIAAVKGVPGRAGAHLRALDDVTGGAPSGDDGESSSSYVCRILGRSPPRLFSSP